MLLTIAQKVLANPEKAPDYLKIFREYVDTDLSMSEILWFVEPVLGLDLESVETATLPGDGTVSYRGGEVVLPALPGGGSGDCERLSQSL